MLRVLRMTSQSNVREINITAFQLLKYCQLLSFKEIVKKNKVLKGKPYKATFCNKYHKSGRERGGVSGDMFAPKTDPNGRVVLRIPTFGSSWLTEMARRNARSN